MIIPVSALAYMAWIIYSAPRDESIGQRRTGKMDGAALADM